MELSLERLKGIFTVDSEFTKSSFSVSAETPKVSYTHAENNFGYENSLVVPLVPTSCFEQCSHLYSVELKFWFSTPERDRSEVSMCVGLGSHVLKVTLVSF